MSKPAEVLKQVSLLVFATKNVIGAALEDGALHIHTRDLRLPSEVLMKDIGGAVHLDIEHASTHTKHARPNLTQNSNKITLHRDFLIAGVPWWTETYLGLGEVLLKQLLKTLWTQAIFSF